MTDETAGIQLEAPGSEWVEYIPEWRDNRDKAVPMSLEIHPMSAAEMRDWRMRMAGRLSGKDTNKRALAMVERVIRERTRAVRHYRIAGQQIETGDDLVRFGLDEINTDIFQAITDVSHLDDAIKKNCCLPSTS